MTNPLTGPLAGFLTRAREANTSAPREVATEKRVSVGKQPEPQSDFRDAHTYSVHVSSNSRSPAGPVEAPNPVVPEWRRPVRRLWFEICLSWRFIGGDASSMLLPPMLFTSAAWRSLGGDWKDLLESEGAALGYFWLALYLFCISNQTTGIAEDSLNKPHRPLVTGKISLRGAFLRWWCVFALYMALGVLLGIPEWTALWAAMTVLYNHLGWARRWYGKNLCIAIATFAQLAAAWEISGPLTKSGWRVIAAIIFLFNLVMSVQDLRDIAGDFENNRRTLPMVIGQWPTRIFAAIGLSILPVAVHYWIFGGTSDISLSLRAYEGLLAAVSWIAAARVLLYRDPASDHRTYLLYTTWYCLLVTSSIAVPP
ncbi:UbiA family prenyltransferase [Streptomyces sp. NBC_01304]|uniref:UbiA family prenyltransferase n=1 Tax=Streptomyces sp. NBC_01304 TaxID=2903818 RepID=UPI002E1116C2|nr:UbiA family prenyltransferase [Streptomyces sp. NBC_01304]